MADYPNFQQDLYNPFLVQLRMEDAKKNAFKTYNRIADWYSKNRSLDLKERPYLDKLIILIGKGSNVLDLGCGTGQPMMAYLLKNGIHVTGVDASHTMLEMAKLTFPFEHFIQADMRALSLNKKFDGILAWHSLFHLPVEDQPGMFTIFKEHLNSNGILMFTSGTEKSETWGMNGGEKLFQASLDSSEYSELLQKHHFEILLYNECDVHCGNANVWMARFE